MDSRSRTKSSGDGPRGDALAVVAHPDDEVLWSGGLILTRPIWSWHVIGLCRGSDPDRAPKFRAVLQELGAEGDLGDLDDGPAQRPIPPSEVEEAIQALLPARCFDLIITHGPRGEYTRHRRHEEVCLAVVSLWSRGVLTTDELMMFAYEDGDRSHYPRAIPSAPRQVALDDATWRRKRALITETYGFTPESWEAQTTPRVEAFWSFRDAARAAKWVNEQQRGLVE